MISYCTLFDSYYLDKGIALAVSLSKYLDDNKLLYIYAFDQRAYDVLTDLKIKNVVPVLFEDIIFFLYKCSPSLLYYYFGSFYKQEGFSFWERA